ncbi:hypothetical protein ASF00_16485 [Sphingomonas sp. Leaf34]|nr:hypothetical protein ASF00_16485 [Sphingomonas sp. Leaf34]KQN27914.1 hypothetical protein ASE88_16540 [Sphingomonas sp. Leaf38]
MTKAISDRERKIADMISPEPRGLVLGDLQYTNAGGAGAAAAVAPVPSIRRAIAPRILNGD